MSLRLRLILLLLGVYAIGGWLITRWAVGQVRPRYFEAMEETMVETALLLAGVVETAPSIDAEGAETLATVVENAAREPYEARIFELVRRDFGLRVLVADGAGTILYDSAGEALGEDGRAWREIARALEGQYGARARHALRERPGAVDRMVESSPRTLREIYVAAPVYRGPEIVGAVSVGKSTASIDILVQAAQFRILLGMGAGGVGLLLVLLLAANWVVGPLERLARWARTAGGPRRENPPLMPGGTLGALRQAMVTMRDTLEGQDAIERYTRTLAHELKAPLTAIRGAAEILREDPPAPERERFQHSIGESAERIRRIVDELLALSRLESGRPDPRRERLDLTEVANEAADGLQPAFDAAQVRLVRELSPQTLAGDRALLRRGILNLLQNALEFAPAGTTVTLRLEAGGGSIVLRVEDAGPGLPAFARDRIFERFFSLPRPRTGQKSTGLGLSLVAEIMALHDGRVTVENRSEGGVCASLLWPRKEAR